MTDIVYNKNGIPFDIDAIATDLNGKMDTDGVNAVCPTLLSRTANNQGGVTEIWSDGYCVQTGVDTTFSDHYITLPTQYKDDSYFIFLQGKSTLASSGTFWVANTKTTSQFYVAFYRLNTSQTSEGLYWRTEGYIR